jgi:hypothetical protein
MNLTNPHKRATIGTSLNYRVRLWVRYDPGNQEPFTSLVGLSACPSFVGDLANPDEIRAGNRILSEAPWQRAQGIRRHLAT